MAPLHPFALAPRIARLPPEAALTRHSKKNPNHAPPPSQTPILIFAIGTFVSNEGRRRSKDVPTPTPSGHSAERESANQMVRQGISSPSMGGGYRLVSVRSKPEAPPEDSVSKSHVNSFLLRVKSLISISELNGENLTPKIQLEFCSQSLLLCWCGQFLTWDALFGGESRGGTLPMSGALQI